MKKGARRMNERKFTGRVVKMFITSSDPRSLRHVELDNWTGLAITGQSEFFKEAVRTEELRKSCVYLLIQTGREDDLPKVYAGESDDFTKRYPQDQFPIDFDTFIVFTSKDDNLTRAHVKWLELELWRLLSDNVGKVAVANANRPTGSNLPKADKATMATYLANMIFVLEALGFDLFTRDERDPLSNAARKRDTSKLANDHGSRFQTAVPNRPELLAHLQQSEDGYILTAGSKLNSKATESLPLNVRRLREQMLRDGVIFDCGDYLELKQDISFSKPSPASALVKGRSSTGHADWTRVSDGMPLGRVILGVFG